MSLFSKIDGWFAGAGLGIRPPSPVADRPPESGMSATPDMVRTSTFASSQGMIGPSGQFRSNLGEYARYTPQRDILLARRLWATDGYASEIINNIVAMAAGSGAKIIFAHPAWKTAWESWQWNRANPRDRGPTLFQTMILRLIRDGSILDVQRVAADGMPYLRMLNPAWLYGTSGQDAGYSGVEVDSTGKPIIYNYRPQFTYVRTAPSERLRADEVILTFKTEWDEPQLLGETWLRKSLKALDMLDGLDASMVFSVWRAAKTPALYKVPIDYAFEYVRELDPDGNPIDPDESTADQIAAAKQLLERTIGAPGEDGVVADDVELMPRPFQPTMNDPVRMLLLQRACRGIGVSVPAALGEFGNGGYLSNRFAVAQDEKFYGQTQALGERHLREVVEWWQGVMANTSLDLMRADPTFKIELPVFPMANLQQDVMAMKGLRDMGAVSTQTVARRYGYDPYAEAKEMARWQEMMMESAEEPEEA